MYQTPTQLLTSEVEARMRALFSDKPPALVATIEQLIMADREPLRPTIIQYIGSMFNAERENLLNLAAAVEMMHTAILVHDELVDVVDQPTGEITVNTRFATAATILAGDLSFAAAAQLAAAVNKIEVMKKFPLTLQFSVNGEITYMFNNGDRMDKESYFNWIHAKIASLFELASGMAATLGSADPNEIKAATEYGYNLGMATRISQEVANFSGNPSQLDKPAGFDLHQGKLTLPVLLYFETHPDNLEILKNNGNGRGHMESLITEIRQSDAIHQAAREAQRFIQQGLEALDNLPDTPERDQLVLLTIQAADLGKWI